MLTGSEKAFAAGADIKEMQDKSFAEVFLGDFISRWENVSKARKPMIAAVAGFALGGGCELAMMCDFILAADTAKFGQPEIKLGVIPGAGGTQRLTRFVGKSKAMEMFLTGRMMDAAEAERSGLVSRVVPAASLIEEALKIADAIAALVGAAVYAAKESVNRAYETTLAEGVRFERRIFHSLFATEDQKEGMRGFVEKRRRSSRTAEALNARHSPPNCWPPSRTPHGTRLVRPQPGRMQKRGFGGVSAQNRDRLASPPFACLHLFSPCYDRITALLRFLLSSCSKSRPLLAQGFVNKHLSEAKSSGRTRNSPFPPC